MSKINKITPIQDGMSKIEAEQATKLFLRELLQGNLLQLEDIVHTEVKSCGARGYKLITLRDDSSWVVGAQGLERLIGAAYLKNNLSLDKWDVSETKCFLKDELKENINFRVKKAEDKPLQNILTIHSDDFISCSKYVGDKKPAHVPFGEPGFGALVKAKSTVTLETGFNDFAYNANLREQDDGTIILIDTEYRSFSNNGATPISPETDAELGGVEFSFPLTDILG